MAGEGSVAIPTGATIGRSLSSYGTGLIAGLGFNIITALTRNFIPGGGGLIGGAIAAAITGAVVPGRAGEIVAVTLGFATGQAGLGALMAGFGGSLGALGGGGGGGGDPGIRVI